MSKLPNAVGCYSPYGFHVHDIGDFGLLGYCALLRQPWGYLSGNGYRAYSPALMRFCSPDASSPFERGGLNTYTYCLGDPVNRTDPTGHWSVPELLRSKKANFNHYSAKFKDQAQRRSALQNAVLKTQSKLPEMDDLSNKWMSANYQIAENDYKIEKLTSNMERSAKQATHYSKITGQFFSDALYADQRSTNIKYKARNADVAAVERKMRPELKVPEANPAHSISESASATTITKRRFYIRRGDIIPKD
ncbi:RHS repeat-associated core domain-containing protein [Pseudomonas putida]